MGFSKDIGEEGQRLYVWGEPHFPLENEAIGIEVKAVHQVMGADGTWKNAGKPWLAGHFTIDATVMVVPETLTIITDPEIEGLVSGLVLCMSATPESMGKTAQSTIYECIAAWVDKFIQANISQVGL